MNALSQHRETVKNPFAEGSVSSVCMHYGGLVGDHTTASMVVSLEEDRITVWTTGSSCPCVSLFKPWVFGSKPVLPVVSQRKEGAEKYWLEAEEFRRDLLGKKIPAEFYAQRNELQNRWNKSSAEAEDPVALSEKCLQEERTFFDRWKKHSFESCVCSIGFRKRWGKKTDALMEILLGEDQ